MNRRDFMGTVVAGAAATQLPGAGGGAAAEVPASLPRARWLENGLIDAGGTHEPYIFVLRRGGERLDARQEYEHQQSEDLIRRLKEQGVEVFHTHLYKGFGMAAEKAGMEDTRRAAEIAHRYGLKVDTYIQWNTMMYETFFTEEPRAKDWVQRDIDGRPILLTYGFQQSFRYRPCFARQEYRDYLKRIVRFAVEEVHTDFIHFDNFDLNAEPDSCHCPACVEGFRNFLKAKYSPQKSRERFGFENVGFVNPPQWNRENRPEKMEIIFDPAIQEWVDFRCQLMADALREMALYAKSLNPSVAIEINPHGVTGANRAWENAIDHARLLKWTEAFWTEEENLPTLTPDGRLVSKIRSYKLARAFDNILLTYITGDPVAMAECLAFNQTLGYVGEDPLSPDMRKYLEFYRRNRELFVGSRDVANVAIFRSYPSITYHNARAQLSAVLVEQALIQARVPFALIFDEHLNGLMKYRVVVLPDSECLSDEQLKLLKSFVEQGGGLVATGQAGFYDEWRRLRVEPGLSGLAEPPRFARAYEETVEGGPLPGGPAVRKEVGKGRVVYFPGVEFDGALPASEPYSAISNRFWKRPKNWDEIVEGVRWTARQEIPLRVEGPDYLIANLVEQLEQRRRILHLVNYNAKNVPTIPVVEVWCGLPQGATAKEARLLLPDERESPRLEFQAKGAGISFEVPKVETYAVAVVNW
jgi:glycosyl hydrolase family 42 (putative beta-galactosidase)